MIACGDCGAQISARARACPRCGAPRAADARQGVITTQQTGKIAKLQMAAAIVVMIVGAVMFATGDAADIATGGLLVLGGLFWWLGVRMVAWWRYG